MFYCTLTRSKEHRKGQHSTVVKVKPPLATTATTVYGLDYADGWVPVDYSLAVDEEYEKREERRKIIGGKYRTTFGFDFSPRTITVSEESEIEPAGKPGQGRYALDYALDISSALRTTRERENNYS